MVVLHHLKALDTFGNIIKDQYFFLCACDPYIYKINNKTMTNYLFV